MNTRHDQSFTDEGTTAVTGNSEISSIARNDNVFKVRSDFSICWENSRYFVGDNKLRSKEYCR